MYLNVGMLHLLLFHIIFGLSDAEQFFGRLRDLRFPSPVKFICLVESLQMLIWLDIRLSGYPATEKTEWRISDLALIFFTSEYCFGSFKLSILLFILFFIIDSTIQNVFRTRFWNFYKKILLPIKRVSGQTFSSDQQDIKRVPVYKCKRAFCCYICCFVKKHVEYLHEVVSFFIRFHHFL